MNKVIVIVGPTGVGKTKLSIELAKKYNGEIINGDSMQVYKEMNIGTAKIKEEEKEEIPHHLFSILSFKESNSIYEFQTLVRNKIEEITSRNKLPIIVGGTGLYLKACLYDYEFKESNDNSEILKKYENYTNIELHEELKKVDPISAEKIHFNNRRRVLRALEIYLSNQESKSNLEAKQEHKLLYDACFIGLTIDRKVLHHIQDLRVDKMIEEGLVEEVKYLLNNDEFLKSTASQAIGYKEFIPYFKDEITLEQAIEQIKIHTHQYAKRQYTFFNNQLNVNWIEVDLNNFNKTIETANNIIDG